MLERLLDFLACDAICPFIRSISSDFVIKVSQLFSLFGNTFYRKFGQTEGSEKSLFPKFWSRFWFWGFTSGISDSV